MPELPEVEVQVRGLSQAATNQKIVGVGVLVPNAISDKMRRAVTKLQIQEFIYQVTGQTIETISRRGKYILFTLTNHKTLVIHLKMTGQWQVLQPESELPYATGLILQLQNGTRLAYRDTRKFGYVIIKLNDELDTFFTDKQLGPDPFSGEYTVELFKTRLKRKSNSTLKSVLLSQYAVVGLGNIYVDELCFRTHIRPTRLIKNLTNKNIVLLYTEIITLLTEAIAAGGSSLTVKDSLVGYRGTNGASGTFASQHLVYGRGGKHCVTCGSDLAMTQISSRTTVYCKSCQK
jgi:formamidopyrimidine-DNA glycosylase